MFLKFKVKQILIISILCGLTQSLVNADKWGKRGYGQSPPGFQLINQGILPYYMPFRHQGSKGQTLAEDGCDEGNAGEEMAESDPSNVGSEQEVGQQPNANRFGSGFGFLKNEKKGKHGHGKHKKAKKPGNISKTTSNIMSWFKLLPKLIPALKVMLQMVCGVTPNPLEDVVNPKVMDAINSVCSIVGILSLGGKAQAINQVGRSGKMGRGKAIVDVGHNHFMGKGGNMGEGGNMAKGGNMGKGEDVGKGGNMGGDGYMGKGGNVGKGGSMGKDGNVGNVGNLGKGGNMGKGGSMGKGGNVGKGGNMIKVGNMKEGGYMGKGIDEGKGGNMGKGEQMGKGGLMGKGGHIAKGRSVGNGGNMGNSGNVPDPISKRHLGKKGQQHTSSKNPGRPSRDGPDIILDMIHMVQLLLSGPCRELHYVTDKSYPNSAKELCISADMRPSHSASLNIPSNFARPVISRTGRENKEKRGKKSDEKKELLPEERAVKSNMCINA